MGYDLYPSALYYLELAAQVKKPDPWIDVFKLANASFFAFHQGRVLPTHTLVGFKPRFLLLGRAQRFFDSVCRRNKETRKGYFPSRNEVKGNLKESLLATIQTKLKRALPLPSEERVEAGLNDMIEKVFVRPPALLSERPYGLISSPLWSKDDHKEEIRYQAVGTGNYSLEQLVNEVKRRTSEVIRGHRFDAEAVFSTFFPSTSANYINSRANGGTVTALYDDPDIQCVIRRFYEGKNTSNKLLESLMRLEGVNWDDFNVKILFSRMYLNVLNKCLSEKNHVVGVGLAEALKVRVITKSPPFRTFVLKPMQHFIHNIMRQHPTFRLIGEPSQRHIINECFAPWLQPDSQFLSGDYTDATNCLRFELSEACAQQLITDLNLGSVYGDLLLDSLTRHIYTIDSADHTVELTQKNGQLMGSVTSFIVLCFVNAAICSLALEKAYKPLRVYKMSGDFKMRLEHLPLLINGDDCVFLANKNVHDLWCILGNIAGLSPSIGKYFLSDKLLQINSVNYLRVKPYLHYKVIGDSDWPDLQPYWCRFEEVPVVQLGLISGVPRSVAGGTDVDFYKVSTLSTRQRTVLEKSPPILRLEVNKFFWERNMGIIRNSGLPYYVPTTFGGLGLIPRDLSDPEESVSDVDRRIMTGIILDKFKIKTPVVLNPSSPWSIRSRCEQIAKESGIKYGWRDHPQLVLDDFNHALTMCALFSGFDHPDKIFDYKFDDDRSKFLFDNDFNRNRRFWASAHTPRAWKHREGLGCVTPISYMEYYPYISGLVKRQISDCSRFALRLANQTMVSILMTNVRYTPVDLWDEIKLREMENVW